MAASPVSTELIGTSLRVSLLPTPAEAKVAGSAAGGGDGGGGGGRGGGGGGGGETFESELFAIEGQGTADELVIFRRQKTHTWQKADYRVVPRRAIAELVVLARSGAAPPPLREFSEDEVQRRYADGAAREQKRLSRRGQGVSESGQRLFDALLPNFPDLRRVPGLRSLSATIVSLTFSPPLDSAAPLPLTRQMGREDDCGQRLHRYPAATVPAVLDLLC